MLRFFLVLAFSFITSQAMSQEDLPLTTRRVIMETPYGGAVFISKASDKIVDAEGFPVSVEKATLHLIESAPKSSEVAFLDLGVLGLKKINIRNGQITLSGTRQGLPPGISGTIYRIAKSIEYEKELTNIGSSFGLANTNHSYGNSSNRYSRVISPGLRRSFNSLSYQAGSTRLNSYRYGMGLGQTYGRSSSLFWQNQDCNRGMNPYDRYENLSGYNGLRSGITCGQQPFAHQPRTAETTSLVGSYDSLFLEASEKDSKSSK